MITMPHVVIMRDHASPREPRPWVVLLRVGEYEELFDAPHETHARLIQEGLQALPDDRVRALLGGQE